MKKALALCAALALSACANGPGGVFTTQSLTQAQAAAGNILQVIKTEAGIYVQQPGVDPGTAAKVTLAVNSLSAAVASFQAISSFGNVDQLATAVLSTASAVVNVLPNVSAQDKVAIDGAVAVLEVLLPVVLPQGSAVPANPVLVPGGTFYTTTPATVIAPLTNTPTTAGLTPQ